MNYQQRKIDIELAAAKAVRDSLLEMGEDSPELIRDMIEGQTSVFELLEGIIKAIGEEEASVEALKAYIDTLTARKKAAESRIEKMRATIQQALEAIGETKLQTPFGTVTIREGRPSVVITDENQLPKDLFLYPAPQPDKKAIYDALSSGDLVTGAYLSNGKPILSIRRG